MKRDAFTLPLFDSEWTPVLPPPAAAGLPAHWPPAKRENFTWWCQNGNRELCAAVLWKSEGLTQGEAQHLVQALHRQPVMTHDSPPCAAFARPLGMQGAHA